MKVLNLRWRSIKLVAVFGAVVLTVLNLMTWNQPTRAAIEQAELSALAGKVIVLDPGHGGVDGGARYNGLVEKDITLALARKLGDILEAHGAQVIYTRNADVDYYTRGKGGKRNDLLKRVEIINQAGAALFISIHTNAIVGSRWLGAETYYNPKIPENRELAQTLQLALQDFPPGNTRQAKQDLDILVLKDTTVPGVLLEAGFLSNPREAALLANGEYQQKMAWQIAKALAYHFGHYEGR